MYPCRSVLLTGLTVLFTIILLFSPVIKAKSLYVVMHEGWSVNAYKIQDSNIQYQTNSSSQAYHVSGPVGLTLDPNSGFLFMTSEDSGYIEYINAKTMIFEEDLTDNENAASMSGIVFDQNKKKLYVVDRGTEHLYVFFWYEPLRILLPDGESYVVLSELGGQGAYGIDIDESNGDFYVTNAENVVHRYNTSDWEHEGNIPIVVNSITRSAVGIAIDSTRHYMYTGSFTGKYGDHYYLVRTNITDPNNPTFSEKYIGAYVIGLAVDEETGYLYVGTKYDSNYTIQVFNTLTWPSDPCFTLTNGVDGPAGMCLGGDIEYKPPDFLFEKVDINEPNWVLPEDYITYRITYGPNGVDQNNIVITDYLPTEVNYEAPLDPNYNAERHTYTWPIGHLNANDPNNSVTLTVKVNYGAAPNSVITNFCVIESDDAYKTAFADTNVGFWQPDSYIIYVDYFSPCPPGTGISWQFAYSDLQDALERAADGNDHQIWVANGTYIPSVEDPYYGLTFKLIDGVSLYGHFVGNETSIYQRNLTNPASETILSGEGISPWYLVTASGLNQNTNLDGFTITGNSTLVWIETAKLNIKNCLISGNDNEFGISADHSEFTVAYCTIQNVSSNGIYSTNSNFTITDCNIHDNGIGIKVQSSLTGSLITNNIIHNNITAGIAVYDSDSLLVVNNLIHHNISDGIFTQNSNITYQNNTIVSNGSYGINDHDTMDGPTIHNCIIWNNAPDLLNTGSDGWYHATYSCFTSYDIAVRGTGNIYGDANDANDPCFVDVNLNNFHLDPNSPCIDKGDPNGNYDNQTDIDGEPRISNGRIEMGADEKFIPKADYDHNDIMNFNDYAIWAKYWLTNDPNGCLDDDNDVDIIDLAVFCDEWLWIAPWSPLYQSLGLGNMDMMSESSSESFVLSEEMPAEPVSEESTQITDQPMSDEQIQTLIDWTEQLWESTPELWDLAGQAGYDLIMESLKEQLGK